WSATGSHFRLAKLILLDDFEFAYELMRKIGIDDEKLTKEYYRGWPLFKMIKKEEKFRETFEEIFGEPYNKIEQEVSQFPDDLLSEDSGILSGTPKSAPQ
ncbi:MAG: hypothetical protein OEZ02_13915, partial [Anaerolineae bacterium]|nr:hypothetical protein [Anaerolineae bacterium]